MTDPLTILYETLQSNPYTNLWGDKIWMNDEKEKHRLDGPAVIMATGTKEWWVNGERHREGGPAVEHANGNTEWWINDKVHREDGPAIRVVKDFLIVRRHSVYPVTNLYFLDDLLISEEDWKADARVKKALVIKKLEDKETKDDDFLRTFGEVI